MSNCAPLSILDLMCSLRETIWICVYYVHVSEIECCGVSKEYSVSEVSEPRFFDSTPLRLGEFPLQFPSAGLMLGKESRARKIYVDVSNENTTIPPPRLTIFVKQRFVRSFFSSPRSLLSPWIFPFLLMYISKNLNSCWWRVSHFTWLVVSAGTLVIQLTIGFFEGWAGLWVSLKVLSSHISFPKALYMDIWGKVTKEFQMQLFALCSFTSVSWSSFLWALIFIQLSIH